MANRAIFQVILLSLLSFTLHAQQWETPDAGASNSNTDSVFSLNDCLRYALKHQPALKQSYIDEAIAHTNNLIAFSSWLPQVNGAANVTHYFQTPPTFASVNGNVALVPGASFNTSIPSVAASQTIFSTDVLLAARAAKLNTLNAQQHTTASKIDLVSNVSKAFYDLLLSVEQVGVYKEDTARLKKNQADAYNRYVAGVADKVDYKQASISLNNSLSRLKTAVESADAKSAVLKQVMGFPPARRFGVQFDTVRMMQEIYADTAAQLQFEKRIEYQELITARRLQHESTAYYQLSFLPSLSAFYNYNYEFAAKQFSDLYSQSLPYSMIGLQLNIPLFTGFRRMGNIHKAKLQEERTDWDIVNAKLTIYAQYKQALAGYKSNLYYLNTQADNVSMAREVYNIVKLQYSEGVKAYLDVIIAESDLQTSEINYLNALFQVLQSKIDLEKAMGDIPTEI